MTVRTLFFASYRDIAGADEVDVVVAPGTTVRELISGLRDRGGSWSRLPAEPAVAVNQEYASLATPLSDGDEVAFIPPVSGG
jgi:molybdopterin converting factor subunit 1